MPYVAPVMNPRRGPKIRATRMSGNMDAGVTPPPCGMGQTLISDSTVEREIVIQPKEMA